MSYAHTSEGKVVSITSARMLFYAYSNILE